MNDMVPIRSVKQYIKEFGVNGIGKGMDPKLVKEQILDAFQKEIFGQLMFKYNNPDILSVEESSVDEQTREGVRNILKNANRKWGRLCIEFSKYKDTYSLIYPSELMERMRDIVKIQVSERKNPEEIPVDIGEPSQIQIIDN